MQHPEFIHAIVACADDDFIKSRIFTVRGVQVMLDSDLAKIYQVETRVFNQSVKRNENRFPLNFRFRLELEEYRTLISQIVTSKNTSGETRGGRQKAPYVFTEQGIAMLSGVLKSDEAVQVSVRLMNIFVTMRKALASIALMMSRLEVAERRQIVDQQRNEERFETIFKAMDGGDFPPQMLPIATDAHDATSIKRPAASWTSRRKGSDLHADLRWFMKGNKLILALAGVACIAAHADDVATGRFNGENFLNGWVNICDNPYPETIDAVRWIGDNMYSMRFGKESKEVVP